MHLPLLKDDLNTIKRGEKETLTSSANNLKNLTLERSSIQHRIDEAKNNVEQIEEKVLNWLGEVDELSEQVLKFHEESQAKIECNITSCPNPWLRYKLSKRAETIAQEAVKIYEKRNFDRVSYRVPPQSMPELTNRESNKGIDSRVEIMNHIMEALRNPRFNMIGLCGLGGVGKTTIAKDVEKEEKNQKVFEKVIMATVSQQEMNIGQIQDQIIEKLEHHEGATKNVSNKTFKSLFNSKVLLPKLEILELSNLWSMLTPLVLKSLNNLEEVEVIDCDMLEIVFDFEDLNDYHKEMNSSSVVVPLKMLKLWNLPKLKNVWSNNCQGNISFPSLRSIAVSDCKSLTSIFPALSIAKGMLGDLEELQISNCSIDVIVAKDLGYETVAAAFQFPGLTSLKLHYLPQLTNFYPHRHTIEWPHLQRLSIINCDEIEIFEKEVSNYSEIYEEDSILNSKYPLFSQDKVIHNLEELNLEGKRAEMIGSGQFPMYPFPKVKLLRLYVHNATTILYKTLLKRFPKLEELQLRGCFAKAFGGDDAAALASPFPKLTLYEIEIKESLSPLLVSSPNLTHIEVTYCRGLTTLMTSSTARCLVHLTHLSVGNCRHIEEIITKQEGENDEDKEIVFIKLKTLVLHDLKLKKFCGYNYSFRFPLLDQLVIKACPSFKIFSPGFIDTPSLKSIQLSQHGEKQHEVWDADLNKTIYQQGFMRSREVVLDEDDARMIRNDQFPADHWPQVEIVCIERFVEEWVTFPYALLERLPKLNELHVKNSSFREMFSSHAPSSTSFHNLTVLKLSKCHQLVYLMTNSTAKSLVNLETLEICDCEKLEDIIRKELNEDVEGGITLLSGLRILNLIRLPRLKTQEDKKDFNIEDKATNTRCTNISISLFSHKKVLLPKLERLELSYLLNNLISLIWDDHLLHNSFNNLKTLILGGCDFMKNVPLRMLKYLNNLEKLEVIACHKLEMVFGFEDLNDYNKEMESSLVVVPLSLTHLEVEGCCGLTTLMTSAADQSLVHITHLSISNCDQIEEIIMKQEGEDDEDREILFSKMKFLELAYLPRLKRFCGYNYTFIFPLLEYVTITECPRLTMFCLEAIHAPQLQSIRVDKCKGDKHIWMTDLNSTIKHLFTFKEVISTTRSMAINAKNITMIVDFFTYVRCLYVESFTDEGVTFPFSSLIRFPRLHELHVEHCSFEEIFPSQDQIEIIDFMEILSRLMGLCIANMDKLKSIWKDDSQLPRIHQHLEFIKVESCCSLVKLAPSSASFRCLFKLSLSRCHQLIHLVTTSTAKSLVNLEKLEIKECKRMEEIVMNVTNEDVQGGITFDKLDSIKLTDMPSLKMFSSQSHTFEFPELKDIEIRKCPEMKKFCPGVLKTPKLSKVEIEEHGMEWKDEEDLNKTMEGLSLTKVELVDERYKPPTHSFPLQRRIGDDADT
ncbi:hypothetical protein K1719_045674 [Acacia pycnantha]|nr:hypothetical protein K1719_045674 [Acacia pycnantha]